MWAFLSRLHEAGLLTSDAEGQGDELAPAACARNASAAGRSPGPNSRRSASAASIPTPSSPQFTTAAAGSSRRTAAWSPRWLVLFRCVARRRPFRRSSAPACPSSPPSSIGEICSGCSRPSACVKMLHELGHALACKHFGGEVPRDRRHAAGVRALPVLRRHRRLAVREQVAADHRLGGRHARRARDRFRRNDRLVVRPARPPRSWWRSTSWSSRPSTLLPSTATRYCATTATTSSPTSSSRPTSGSARATRSRIFASHWLLGHRSRRRRARTHSPPRSGSPPTPSRRRFTMRCCSWPSSGGWSACFIRMASRKSRLHPGLTARRRHAPSAR